MSYSFDRNDECFIPATEKQRQKNGRYLPPHKKEAAGTATRAAKIMFLAVNLLSLQTPRRVSSAPV